MTVKIIGFCREVLELFPVRLIPKIKVFSPGKVNFADSHFKGQTLQDCMKLNVITNIKFVKSFYKSSNILRFR